MLSVTGLQKTYHSEGADTPALLGVSFNIKLGEFIAIMGPSGSGKSTLLHILGFLDRPTGGAYVFNGKKMDELSDEELARVRNKEMGFIFQDFNLLGHATVHENVELPLLYAAEIAPEKCRALVEGAVAAVGLTEKLKAEAGNLSGGQKQRVAIARALVTGPGVIFADEPTGNLDSHSGAAVMEILRDLNNNGHTVVLVTHETYTAEFANRILRLKDGLLESDEQVLKKRDRFFK